MRKSLTILLLLIFFVKSYSQQDGQYTQYMYNTILVNPAYAGSGDSMNIFALYRSQWIGLDGAPVSNSLSINTPINFTNVGLGLSIVNQKIGVTTENNIAVDFSYSVNFEEQYKLSFGLKGSVNILNTDFSSLTQQPGDPLYTQNIDNQFSPNIGVGLYLRSKKSYIGISAPKLFETVHFNNQSNSNSSAQLTTKSINYYLIGGYVFDISDSVRFKPVIFVKYVAGAPLQVDLSTNFLLSEKLTLGVSYRWSAAMSAMVGFQIVDQLFVGYSYDFDTTKLYQSNSGSHEIFLRYEIFNRFSDTPSCHCSGQTF